MRVYHFLSARYGLDALRNGRLRISLIDELNDPFELLSCELSNQRFRKAFLETKAELATKCGLHCFSRRWKNPVLWSHYADKHRGICLGFDVPRRSLLSVRYTTVRTAPDALFFAEQYVREQAMQKILTTKFRHWAYEDEVRLFVSLEDKDSATGHYFSPFSEQLRLTEVVVGSECKISRKELAAAIGEQNSDVSRFKARAAFRTFTVVRNKDESLWT